MRKTSLPIIFLILFVDLLGFAIVVPLLALYAREYGASGKIVGMVVATYSFMQFVFMPIWGRVSDRIGRRPVILMALTGSVVGYLLFAMSRSLAMLFLARAISGLAAANVGTAQAFISDITSPRDRAKGMGVIGAAFGAAFVIGPPIGGLLGTTALEKGYHGNLLPGIAAATLSFIAFSIAMFVLGESKSATAEPKRFTLAAWRDVAADRTLVVLILALFFFILAFAGMETSVPLFTRERLEFSPRDLGYFFGFMGVVVAIVQGGLIGRLSRRFGEWRLIRAGAAILAIGLIAVPAVRESAMLYAVGFLVALGQGLSHPSMTSLVSKSAPADRVGSVLGVSSSMTSLARIVGPLVAGVMYDAVGAAGPFWMAAVFVSVAGALSWWCAVRNEQSKRR